MPKQIITERDIEELNRQGKTSLELTEDTVLTELAYEMARKLGFQLGKSDPGSPAAPIRPYLSQMPKTPTARVPAPPMPQLTIPQPAAAAAPKVPAGMPCAFCQGKAEIDLDALRARVRKAAIARMGDRMDAALIDTIIDRVINNIGLK